MSDREPENHVEVGEPGRGANGEPIRLDRRLYVQLLAFGACRDTSAVAQALQGAKIQGTLYEDINDPLGIALITCSEDPEFFFEQLRPVLQRPPFSELTPKPELTMLGRTYSRGYEPDLVEALIERPKRRLADPALRWGLWYPLRRSGAFERLEESEQRQILSEHGAIGHSFGKAGLAHDVRLDCHGLNKDDNDFVIGVLGPELHPLSLVVQRMRSTRQTSQYLTRLGPFFIGRVFWQSRAGSNG